MGVDLVVEYSNYVILVVNILLIVINRESIQEKILVVTSEKQRQLLASLLALMLGSALVSLTSYCLERIYSQPKKFSTSEPRFDQKTFFGRWSQMIYLSDPLTLLANKSAIHQACRAVEDFKNGKGDETSVKDLWHARKIKDAAVHPDTNEIIPRPFRISGYVPFNGPVCVALTTATDLSWIIFWNWINQSQNASVNYFNRNASSKITNLTLLKSYLAAVGLALFLTVGIIQIINSSYSPEEAESLVKFVAFPASSIAATVNCYMMRRSELRTGIQIMDKNGHVLAQGLRSKVVAKKAVYSTMLSRCTLAIPCFLIPATLASVGPFAAYCQAGDAFASFTVTLIGIISFSFGLPATVAIVPQISSISRTALEPRLSDIIMEDPVYYNKGL